MLEAPTRSPSFLQSDQAILLSRLARMTGQSLTQFLDRPLLDVCLDIEATLADVKDENEQIKRRSQNQGSPEPPPWQG